MKRFFWPGLVFLSTSLLYLFPIIKTPDYNISIPLLIIGIFFLIIGFYKHEFKKLDNKYLLSIIPLLLSLIIIPFPYSLGIIILIISILLYIIKNIVLKNNKANYLFLGISFSGIIICAQTFFYPAYKIFVSHGHRVDFLAPIISIVGNIFGLKTSVNNNIVFLQTIEQTFPVTITFEKLGFFIWLNILIGTIIFLYFISKNQKIIKYIIGFFTLSFVYLILRIVFILFLFTQNRDVTIFWDDMIMIYGFIPFGIILMKFLPLKDFKLDLSFLKKYKFDKKNLISYLLVFIFIFSLLGGTVYQDPGIEKQGKILIDELHSEWENTTRPIDKEWYGMLSTYNYYSWAEWFDKYYNVDRNTDQYLTSDLINNYDILILKCPTNLYEDEEIIDIISFVENGGGLYLIGDHTNVFGMNFYLNQVSENFGISFNTDATYELGTGMTSSFIPEKMFPHTVVQNMEKFEFLTSCTLKAPLNSENIIIGNILLGEPGTYSTENFFREAQKTLDMEYGMLLQVVGLKYGKGRILAFTDSTCFSNFCMFMDGYMDFNLGTIEYLNRENNYSMINTILIIISAISIVVFFYLNLKKNKTKTILTLFIVGILGFSIATPVFTFINNTNYPLPSPHSDYDIVCFDMKHSSADISHSPNIGLQNSINLYGTFFVWTQRVNLFPTLEKTVDDAINKGDAIVIINPDKTFEEQETEKIQDYVKKGGKLLLLDSVLNSDSTSNELIQNFGIWINYDQDNHPLYNNKNQTDKIINNSIGNITLPKLKITGGEDTYITSKNKTQIAVTNVGKGTVVVVTDSYTFSDEILGGTFTEPDKELRSIYDLEYYIFEEILFKK